MYTKPPTLQRIHGVASIALLAVLTGAVIAWFSFLDSRSLSATEMFVLSALLLCLIVCIVVTWRTVLSVRRHLLRSSALQRETIETSRVAVRTAEQFEMLLELIPDAVLKVQDDGVVYYANQRAADLFAYTPVELVGKRIDEILYSRGYSQLGVAELRTVEYSHLAESSRTLSVVGLRRDASEFYAELNTERIEDESQNYLLCLMRDVTKSRELSSMLRESEQNLVAILQNSVDHYWSVDREHRLTVYNQAFASEHSRRCGRPPVIGNVFYHDLDSKWQGLWTTVIDLALEGTSTSFSTQHIVNGEYVYTQSDVRPIRFHEVVCGVSVCETDITQRIKAERRLRRSLERYEIVTRATNEIIWDWNIPKGKMYWGANYEKQFGYRLDKEETESGAWVMRVHEDDRQRIIDEVAAVLADSTREFWEGEYRYIKADGGEILVHDKAFIVRDSTGQALNMIGAMDDVTEQRLLDIRLREFNKELEAEVRVRTRELHEALAKEKELSELKTRFMSMVSHEFRTPLTVILSSTQLLNRYHDRLLEDQKQEYYKVIQHEINHLVSMLNDVLTLGRTASGRVHCAKELISLESFSKSMLSRMNNLDHHRERIDLKMAEGLSTARFDENLMNHALSNLIGNAMKYSPEEARIEFGIEMHEDDLVFKVRDQGIGIPQDDINHLFQPFHRARNVGTIQGTGLGLAIVHEFVQLHGGTISVESTLNVGTTFIIRLPQSEDPVPAQHSPQELPSRDLVNGQTLKSVLGTIHFDQSRN